MKIRPNSLTPSQNSDKTSLRSAYAQTTQSPSSPSQSATSGSVQLSHTARALQQLQNDSQDIHLERVRAIKEALQSGTLQINSAAIADGLLQSAQDLLK